jgi:hypothetical protein
MAHVSDAAIAWAVQKYSMDKDFGRSYDIADAACLVYAMRHDWESLHRTLLHYPVNLEFLTVAAFRMFDQGDVESFDHILDIVPTPDVMKTAKKFYDSNFFFFAKQVSFDDTVSSHGV